MIILLVGLSCSGKTTAVNFFQGNKIDFKLDTDLLNDHVVLPKLVTSTTRLPRNGEVNGIDYNFLTKEEFLIKKENNEFIEDAEVFGNYYGLEFKEYNKHGNALLIHDPKGAKTIKSKVKDTIIIYFDVSPEISLNRMENKRKDNSVEDIKKRMKEIQYFLDFKNECDYIINSNQDINIMLKQINEILKNNIKK